MNRHTPAQTPTTHSLCAMHEKPEGELISSSRNGDAEAMSELFRRHYSYSVRVARRILPLHDDCLDAVQSAYLSAFRHFDSFRGEASFKSWITRIVMNQCLMCLRKPERQFVSLDCPDSGPLRLLAVQAPNPEDLAMRAEIGNALQNAAAQLPKRLSDVFTLCIVYRVSISETARALGLTVQATKTRLFRARSRIRAELKAHPHVLAASSRSNRRPYERLAA
jgi:RNA polymerase sigma-70 factor, ECF subfamily